MFVVGNLVGALAQIIDIALELYMWMIVIAALISWVNPDPYNPIVRFLRGATDPVLRPIRRALPLVGGIDFSPIVAILVIVFMQRFLVQTLRDLAQRM
jgi:YggT family protein